MTPDSTARAEGAAADCATAQQTLSIAQVSTADVAGGAERVAADLHRAFLSAGHDSSLLVGFRFADDPATKLIDNDARRNPWARAMNSIAPSVPTPPRRLSRGQVVLRRACKSIGEPVRAWRLAQGFDDYDFPATKSLTSLPDRAPQVVHLHNLHGGYFDIRALPVVCKSQPTVLTAHDAWLTTGHCAYPVDCERWRTGCGSCPHLDFPPVARRDQTHEGWLVKRALYESPDTKLHLVAPSEWVLKRFEDSIVAPAIASARVIANGIDQSVFAPADRLEVRRTLGLPADAMILVFSGASGNSPYKDVKTILDALPLIGRRLREPTRVDAAPHASDVADACHDRPLVFVMLGASPHSGDIPGVQLIEVAFTSDPRDVARYLQAADIYLHAARAEVLPLSILEAQSCGIPVVVTRTGGAPEAIVDGQTGIVVNQGDPEDLARAVVALACNDDLRHEMGREAFAHARGRFSADTMAEAYLSLYHELIDKAR